MHPGGFLTRQDDHLHISPEVRRSALKQLHLTREISTEFLDRLLQFDRTYFWQHLKFFDRRKVLLQLAKAFGQASDLLQDFDGTIALRSAAFYSDVNETAKALQWCLRAVQCCESAPSRDPWHLANAYLRTAECYQQLNDNASSLKYCKKLLSLPNKDFSPADPDIARIYYQTGLAQVGLNDYTSALKSLSKAQGYSQNTMTVDHPLQSRISNMLSIANKATGNILEAREQKLQSLREFQSRPVINSTALVHKLEQLEKVQAMPAILRGNKDEILYCEIGDLYHGKVTRIMNFGAFVELLPGKDGMIHISKLENRRVEKVEDVVNIGDELEVKVNEIDAQGRINLIRNDIEYTARSEEPRRAEGFRGGNRPPRRESRN